MKSKPLYERRHHFLQVGAKHVISTELQIFNSKHSGNISWFDDNNHLNTVISNIQGGLMYRIDSKDHDDTGLQIVEHDTLILVYKFRKSPSKDSIIVHNDNVGALGLSEQVRDNWYNSLGDGDYTYLILYPEKLIVSVALRNESEHLLDMTEAGLVTDVADGTGGHFANARKATMSENRKKNTLKKIWSTRNRLSTEEVKAAEEEKENCNDVGDKAGTPVRPVVDMTSAEKKDTPVDTVVTFKEKISVFGKDKNNRSSESSTCVEKLASKSTGDSVDEKQAEAGAGEMVTEMPSTSEPQGKPPADTGKEVPISRCVKRYRGQASCSQSTSNSQQVRNAKVIEIDDDEDDDETQVPEENSEVKPSKRGTAEKNTESATSKKSQKNDTKDVEQSAPTRPQKRGVTKSMDDDFSDNDDFSQMKVKAPKATRKAPIMYKGTRRKKKKKEDPSLPTIENEKIIEKGSNAIGRVLKSLNEKRNIDSDDETQKSEKEQTNSEDRSKTSKQTKGKTKSTKAADDDVAEDVNPEIMTMDDLIKNKRKTIEPLAEIPTLLAAPNETINLEDYGQVELEHIASIKELSVEQVRDLVRELEPDLRDIFRGARQCDRHDAFKRGGVEKGSLGMQIAFGLFSETQEEMITNTLIEIFCTRKTKYFDYTMKVLLPETMTLLYAKVEKISYEEADKVIMERC